MTVRHIATEAMDSNSRACLLPQRHCGRRQPPLITAADHNMVAASRQFLVWLKAQPLAFTRSSQSSSSSK
jgi:hypothetical protein